MKRTTKPSRLTKAAPLILLGLLLGNSTVNQRAEALVGGPFDNNSFPGADADGTYSGTITGHNLIGLVTFGVSSAQEAGGRYSIFHEGFVSYGSATGTVDLASRQVDGAFLGVAALTGAGFSRTTVVTTSTTNPQTGVVTTTSTLVTVPPPGVVEPTTQITGQAANPAATSNGGTLTVRSAVEGAFTARMKGYPQAIRFEGSGRLSSSANTAVATTSSAGLDALGNLLPAYTVTFGTNASPAVQTDTVDGSTGANLPATGANATFNAYPQRAIVRSETPFKIRGSRTSRSVYVPTLNYIGVAPSVTANP